MRNGTGGGAGKGAAELGRKATEMREPVGVRDRERDTETQRLRDRQTQTEEKKGKEKGGEGDAETRKETCFFFSQNWEKQAGKQKVGGGRWGQRWSPSLELAICARPVLWADLIALGIQVVVFKAPRDKGGWTEGICDAVLRALDH